MSCNGKHFYAVGREGAHRVSTPSLCSKGRKTVPRGLPCWHYLWSHRLSVLQHDPGPGRAVLRRQLAPASRSVSETRQQHQHHQQQCTPHAHHAHPRRGASSSSTSSATSPATWSWPLVWREARRHLPRGEHLLLALFLGSTIALAAMPWGSGSSSSSNSAAAAAGLYGVGGEGGGGVAASAWTEYGAHAQAQHAMVGEVARRNGDGSDGGSEDVMPAGPGRQPFGGDSGSGGGGGGGGGGAGGGGGGGSGMGMGGDGGGGNVADWFALHADTNTAPQVPESGATHTTAELGPRPNILDADRFPFADVAAVSASEDPPVPPTDKHALQAAPVIVESGFATSWDRGSFTGRFPPLPPPPPTVAPPLAAMDAAATAAALRVVALFGSGRFSTATATNAGRACQNITGHVVDTH